MTAIEALSPENLIGPEPIERSPDRHRPKTQAHREALSKAKIGRESRGRNKKSTNHFRAMIGVLRDPIGRLWRFKNLVQFVRDHPELFNPEDLVIKNRHGRTNAAGCLGALFGVTGRVPGSWKGWTRVSMVERADGLADLLRRDGAVNARALELSTSVA